MLADAITQAEERYYQIISESIHREIRQRGVTQGWIKDEILTRLGITIAQSTISKIINYKGKGHLSLIFVAAICQVLDLDMTGF